MLYFSFRRNAMRISCALAECKAENKEEREHALSRVEKGSPLKRLKLYINR